MSSTVEKRIEELRNEIIKHNRNYYILHKPTISDTDYDDLLLELESLERNNPHLITPDSPTQFVGNDLTKTAKTIKHKFPMLSIQNETDLIAFDKSVRKKITDNEPLEYIVELKIDGLSVNLNYVNGKLKTAATRGDGEIGEDIFDNVTTIKDIPQELNKIDLYKNLIYDIEVRGEIFLSTVDFEEINEKQEQLGKRLFANPRNLAAGIVKMKDASLVAKRPLQNYAYTLVSGVGDFYSQEENLKLLKKLGFIVNDYAKKCTNIDEVIETCNYFEKIREDLPFQIDGAVVKVNLIKHQNILGIGSKYPNWARAFKFPPEKKETVLNNITWQVGRTGIITPVAELKPVRVAGSTIKRATLHNFDEIKRKNLKIGDTVVVEKGGDVIPKIVSIVEEKRPRNAKVINPPDKCPICKSEVINQEGEVGYYCENPECLAQLKGRLVHFVSRSAMDIEGLGESIIDLFVDKGFIKSFADIYRLKQRKNEIIELEGFGDKRIDSLLQAIEKSKNQQFYRILFGVGIRKLGQIGAQEIADIHSTFEEIKNSEILKNIILLKEYTEKAKKINPRSKLNPVKSAREKDERLIEFDSILSKIDELGNCLINIGWYKKNKNGGYVLKPNAGIGSEAAKSVLVFLNSTYGKKIVKELKSVGLFSNRVEEKGNILKGKLFVLTGTLPNLSRPEAIKLILDNGGKAAPGFSKSADYVLAGDDTGTKLSKAKEAGIKIISESELMEMINRKDNQHISSKSETEQLDIFKHA